MEIKKQYIPGFGLIDVLYNDHSEPVSFEKLICTAQEIERKAQKAGVEKQHCKTYICAGSVYLREDQITNTREHIGFDGHRYMMPIKHTTDKDVGQNG